MREARELEAALRRPRPSRQPQGRLENRLMEMADYDGTSHGGRFRPLTEEGSDSEEESPVTVRSQVTAPEEGEESPYRCPHCEETFTTKGNLKRHVSLYHLESQDRDPSLECDKCGGVYSRKDVRDRHRRACKGPKTKKGGPKRASKTVPTEGPPSGDKEKGHKRRRRSRQDGR